MFEDDFNIRRPPDAGVPQYDDFKKYEDEMLQFYGSEIDSIFPTIAEGEFVEPKKLEEYYFVNVFLPFFLGEKNEKVDVSIAAWIGIAGSAYFPVDVIDNKTGEVLFRVPPVKDRNAIHPPMVNGMNNYSVFRDYLSKLMTSAPGRADKVLRNQLDMRLEFMQRPHSLDFIIGWNKVFKRYDKPLIMIEGFTEEELLGGELKAPDQREKEAQQGKSHQDDGIEYEDD